MAALAILNAGSATADSRLRGPLAGSAMPAEARAASAAAAGAVELSRDLLDAVHGAAAQPRRRDELADRLRRLAPERIDGDPARTAFWVNVYNALLLHRLAERPLSGNVIRHLRLFDRVAYDVGGQPYTLNVIEHGILRRNRRPPLRPRAPLRGGDPRLAAAPSQLDPRIHFALNCGARSCPPVRSYDASELDAQLELATRAYLDAEIELDLRHRRISLPGLMRLYRRDLGGRGEQLEFAARRLPAVRSLRRESERRVRVRYRRFDWSAAGGA